MMIMPRFPLLISLFLIFLLDFYSGRARADETPFTPVQAMYMVRDSAAQAGYREVFRWSITAPDDWKRFYNNIPSLPQDTSADPDPLKNQVDDIIILTHTDSNGLTGYDIYVSPLGIMVITRGATHQYYQDNNKFRAFLEDEQKRRASFDNFLKNEVPKNSMGMVVAYNINKSLPNPKWLIDDPENLRLYNSFFKVLTPLSGKPLDAAIEEEGFDKLGHFVLTLNYANAPAQIAVVGKKNIRMSNNTITSRFYQDTGKYYTFFRDQAREMISTKEKVKEREAEAISRRQF
jgi:hypothetical protein